MGTKREMWVGIDQELGTETTCWEESKNYTESPRAEALAENPPGVLADSQQQLPDS